jgi:hypothetical protein
MFVPQGESPDGDGEKFLSNDGKVTISVYGTDNALGQSLQQVFDQDSQGVQVNHRNITPERFTFSGKTGNGMTVYEETLLQGQEFKTLSIDFPTSMTDTYGPIVDHMLGCFVNTTPTQYSN